MKCLFENYKEQTEQLKVLVEGYFSKALRHYDDTVEFLHKIEQIGFTFDWGLDNEPYGLRPIEVSIDDIEF